jgi:hypothetical protein
VVPDHTKKPRIDEESPIYHNGDTDYSEISSADAGSRTSSPFLTTPEKWKTASVPTNQTETGYMDWILGGRTIEYGRDVLYPHLEDSPDTAEKGVRAYMWHEFGFRDTPIEYDVGVVALDIGNEKIGEEDVDK